MVEIVSYYTKWQNFKWLLKKCQKNFTDIGLNEKLSEIIPLLENKIIIITNIFLITFPVLMFFHKLEEIDSKWDSLIPYFCDFYNTVADNDTMIEVAKKVKEHYFQNRPLNANTSREFIKVSKTGKYTYSGK